MQKSYWLLIFKNKITNLRNSKNKMILNITKTNKWSNKITSIKKRKKNSFQKKGINWGENPKKKLHKFNRIKNSTLEKKTRQSKSTKNEIHHRNRSIVHRKLNSFILVDSLKSTNRMLLSLVWRRIRIQIYYPRDKIHCCFHSTVE